MKACLEDLEYKFYTGFFVKPHNFLLELKSSIEEK